MLQSFDIIQGAQSPAHPRVFVIGAFDSRITFYSQQVRALALVHALRDQAILQDDQRVAVVGAGAAGVSAAAAVALLSRAEVDLYERADEILPIQRASRRRRLDPHIYTWPTIDSVDPVADLPILDWISGPAETVRRDVKLEFETLMAACPDRIRVHLRHEITDSRVTRSGPQLDFRRDPDPGTTGDGPDNRVPGQATFHLVLLAFGFGLESPQSTLGLPNNSYWNDAGIPADEFQGRATPRFLISGNGDGGLIDLVAAASDHFDHAGMIRQIVNQPGIEGLFDRLNEIDKRAQKALEAGQGYDFLTAYDAEIREELEGLGMFQLVASSLRPGVRLTLQTRTPEAFSIETATLNRLAAYLVVRACEAGGQTAFKHVHCADLEKMETPENPPYEAEYWFRCGGCTFGVDVPIVRHGPVQTDARKPFEALLGEYAATHEAWLGLHGKAVRVPELSLAARQALQSAARSADLPLPRYKQRQLQEQQPQRIRVQAAGARFRWSGDLALSEAADLWKHDARTVDIYVSSGPAEIGPLAAALVRLALHSRHASLIANVADWHTFVLSLTAGSAHAEHVSPPRIAAGTPAGATQNREEATAEQIAATLNNALSRWVLETTDSVVQDFTQTGRDLGHYMGFSAAADLRARMAEIWSLWRTQLNADAGLLDRLLRLMVCAEDKDEDQDEARVLVGPSRLALIIGAVAAALAVASAWPDTVPRAERPGNLTRALVGAEPRHGHVCAAQRIAREPTAIAAATFMWRTDFVILSHLANPIALSMQAQAGMADIVQRQPGLADQSGSGGIILTIDAQFRAAAQNGVAALTALLNDAETHHFQRLANAIV